MHTKINVYNSSFFQSTIEESQTPSSASQPGSPQFHSTPQKGRQAVNITQPLLLLNVNCQSIISKKAEFQELINTHKPDIVCATETWLAGHHCDGEIGDPLSFINKFEIHRRDRTNRQGGGVFVAVRKDVKSSRQSEIETDCENVWVKLEIPNSPNIYICSYYRPNVNDNESNIALTTSLERLPRNCSTYIAGDFNYPGIKWPEATIQANTPYYNLHADFIDTLHDHGLEQVVYHKTREDNTLDLLVTNNPSSCRNVIVKPGISDHDVVLASLDVNIPRINQVRRKIPLFNKADWCSFHGHMISIHNSSQDMAMTCSADDLWSTFKQGIITCMEKYIPQKFAKEKNGKP